MCVNNAAHTKETTLTNKSNGESGMTKHKHMIKAHEHGMKSEILMGTWQHCSYKTQDNNGMKQI